MHSYQNYNRGRKFFYGIMLMLVLAAFLLFAGCGGNDYADENGDTGTEPVTNGAHAVVGGTDGGRRVFENREAPPRKTFVLDGQSVTLGVPPMRISNVEMVPINIFGILGAFIDWDEQAQTATITNLDGSTISVTVGSTSYTAQGASRTMEAAPLLVFGRMMIPLSLVEATMPVEFVWDSASMILHGISQESTDVVFDQAGESSIQLMSGGLNLPGELEITSWLRPPPNNIIGGTENLPNRPLTNEELIVWIARYEDDGGVSSIENEILQRTNAFRAEHGLPPLQADINLMRAARFKSQEMYDLRYFAHESPVYGGFTGIPSLFGANVSHFGENIAMSSMGSSAQNFVDMWINSPGHRDNMLNPDWTVMGTGVFRGRATQMFSANGSQPQGDVNWVWLPLTITFSAVHLGGLDVEFIVDIIGTGRVPINGELGIQPWRDEMGLRPDREDRNFNWVVWSEWDARIPYGEAIMFPGHVFSAGETHTMVHTFAEHGLYYVMPFGYTGRFFADEFPPHRDHVEYALVDLPYSDGIEVTVLEQPLEFVYGLRLPATSLVESRNLSGGTYSVWGCSPVFGHVCFVGDLVISDDSGTLTLHKRSYVPVGSFDLTLEIWDNEIFITSTVVTISVVRDNRFPSIEILEQIGTVSVRSRSMVNFNARTVNIPEGHHNMEVWTHSWLSSGNMPLIGLASLQVSATGDAVLLLDVSALNTHFGGIALLVGLFLNYQICVGTNIFPLVIDDGIMDPPAIWFFDQNNDVIAGVGGTVSFRVGASNVPEGHYIPHIYHYLLHGDMMRIWLDQGGSGNAYLEVPASIPAGIYSVDVEIFVHGRMVSSWFTLIVSPSDVNDNDNDNDNDNNYSFARPTLSIQTHADWVEVPIVVDATFSVLAPGFSDGSFTVRIDSYVPGVTIQSPLDVSGGSGTIVLRIDLSVQTPGSSYPFLLYIDTPVGVVAFNAATMLVSEDGQVGFSTP